MKSILSKFFGTSSDLAAGTPPAISNYLPDTVYGWVLLGSPLIAALWAVSTFRRNNQLKSAEILANLEKDYSKHINTLLDLENLSTYEVFYRPYIKKALSKRESNLAVVNCPKIIRLEAALRHFYVCCSVRKLGVNLRAIDALCAYYLTVFVDKKNRRHLSLYVRRYWPTVYFWAPLAITPWPMAIWIYLKQIRERFKFWLKPPWVDELKRKRYPTLKGTVNLGEGI